MTAGGLALGALLAWGGAGTWAQDTEPAQPSPNVDATVVKPLSPPIPAPAPPPADTERVGDLQQRLFASQALSVVGDQVTRGGVPVSADAFYEMIERQDLLQRMHARRTGKAVARGIGTAALVIGMVWGIADASRAWLDNSIHRAVTLCPSGDTSGQCADRSSSGSVVPGLMVSGGLITMLTAWAVPVDALGRTEKQRLVDEYNTRLRATVGAPASP